MNTSLELLAGSLGWTLLHFCWQAAAIALVYWIVDLGLPKARSQARYLVSLAAILSMFAASLATLGYEIERNQVDPVVVSSLPAAVPPVVTGNLQATVPRQSGWNLSVVWPWLDVAWLLGVLGLSARTVGGWWWIHRLRGRALADAPASVLAGLSRVRARLGVRWRVDLRISRQIPGPMAIGILRSLILLPASALLALSPEQIEAVLAHELAHVRRADYFWNLIQTMIETLFFFHPAVGWVGGRLREQRELCCDEIAVDFCADPLIYATALLSMEEQRNRKLYLAMALDGRQPRSGLRARIARILGEALPPESRRGLTPLPLAAFCAGLVVLLLPAAQVFGSLGGGLRPSQTQTRTVVPVSAPADAEAPAAEPAKLSAPQVAPRPAAHADPKPAKLPPSTKDADAASLRTRIRRSAMNPQMAELRAQLSRLQAIHAQALTARVQNLPAFMGLQAKVAQEMSTLKIAHDIAPGAAQNALPAAGPDYIRQMRAAGYALSSEQYTNLKIMGVTPEYAQQMQKIGLGKPSPSDLIAMKVQGVTPQYVEKLRASGLQPQSFQEIIKDHLFNLSPEYLSAMKAAGFASLSSQELFELRAQGVAPEYAAAMRKQFPDITVRELIQLRVFKVDDAFIAAAKRHNFSPLTAQKLVRLRISGPLNDSATEPDKGKE